MIQNWSIVTIFPFAQEPLWYVIVEIRCKRKVTTENPLKNTKQNVVKSKQSERKNIGEQESPPAWTQEAYRPPCSHSNFLAIAIFPFTKTGYPPPPKNLRPGTPPKNLRPGTPPKKSETRYPPPENLRPGTPPPPGKFEIRYPPPKC